MIGQWIASINNGSLFPTPYFLLLAWLAICAWQDYRTGQVSNGLTLPPLGLAIATRLAGYLDTSWWIVVSVWTLALYLWHTDKLGGADAKAWMTFALLGNGILWMAFGGLMIWYAALAWAFSAVSMSPARRFPGFPGYLLGASGMTLLYLGNPG